MSTNCSTAVSGCLKVTWRQLSYQPPSAMLPRPRTSLWLSSTPSYPHHMRCSSSHSCVHLKLVMSIRQSWTNFVSKDAAAKPPINFLSLGLCPHLLQTVYPMQSISCMTFGCVLLDGIKKKKGSQKSTRENVLPVFADGEHSASHACLCLLEFQFHVSLNNHCCCLLLCVIFSVAILKKRTVLYMFLWSTLFVKLMNLLFFKWDFNTKCPCSLCFCTPLLFFCRHNHTYKWSSDGCRVTSVGSGVTSCLCNHTTNFAVLMSYLEPKVQNTNTALLIFKR